jgi:hypothetical protein
MEQKSFAITCFNMGRNLYDIYYFSYNFAETKKIYFDSQIKKGSACTLLYLNGSFFKL